MRARGDCRGLGGDAIQRCALANAAQLGHGGQALQREVCGLLRPRVLRCGWEMDNLDCRSKINATASLLAPGIKGVRSNRRSFRWEVFRKGQNGHEFFVILSGQCEVLIDRKQVRPSSTLALVFCWKTHGWG